MNRDETFMLRCFELAALGAGRVAPNPLVGAVVVHGERIIGEGYHAQFGEAHAEVNALQSVKNASLLPDSTLYVNLEPCAHFGKTPPCADLIVEQRIPRVVIGCRDPFAQVNGAGIDRLRNAGIDVRVGVLESESKELNRRFLTFHEKRRPYIILKWAETADGSVDAFRTSPSAKPLKITCPTSDVLVHKWRSEEAAIMVGSNTALLDNPNLTTRKFNGPNPIRILIDQHLKTPASAKLLDGSVRTIVFTTENRPSEGALEYIQVKDTRNLTTLMDHLYTLNIQAVMIEGGPTLQRLFLEAGLWDEMRRFVSTEVMANGPKAPVPTAKAEQERSVGSDLLFIYRNR